MLTQPLKVTKVSAIPKYARDRFRNRLNFVVSLLAATIGLGDVLRFPHFMIKQGENSFLVPYFLTIFIIGIPLVSMELFLGQFTSAGPATCWEFSPIFRGVGIGSVVLVAFTNVFYQVDLAIAALYTFKSLVITVPWKYCDRQWATDFCFDFLNISSAGYCRAQGWNVSSNGACYNETVSPRQIKSLWNVSLAGQNNIKRVIPALEYFTYYVQGVKKPGEPRIELHPEIIGCLVFVWFVICLALMWGLNSFLKAMYFAVIYTFIALIAQLILYLSTVDGAFDGVKVFFEVDFRSLTRANLWLDAANQVFFTLSVNTGALVTLASFNNFRGDCVMFACVMAGGNVVTSLLAGCITFGALGSLSKELNIPIFEIDKGSNLGFVVYPHALASLPASAVWSGIFFFMMFIVGASSAMVYVQTVLTALHDVFPIMRQYKMNVLIILCIFYCLMGTILVVDAEHNLINILQEGVFSFDIFVLSFLQCIALAWVYGVKHLLQDISYMIGDNVCGVLPWKWLKYGFALSWAVFCPIFTSINIIARLRSVFLTINTAPGAMKLLISALILLPIPMCAIHALPDIRDTHLKRLYAAFQPSDNWGPVLPKDRNIWLAGRKRSASKPKSEETSTTPDDASKEEMHFGTSQKAERPTPVIQVKPATCISQVEIATHPVDPATSPDTDIKRPTAADIYGAVLPAAVVAKDSPTDQVKTEKPIVERPTAADIYGATVPGVVMPLVKESSTDQVKTEKPIVERPTAADIYGAISPGVVRPLLKKSSTDQVKTEKPIVERPTAADIYGAISPGVVRPLLKESSTDQVKAEKPTDRKAQQEPHQKKQRTNRKPSPESIQKASGVVSGRTKPPEEQESFLTVTSEDSSDPSSINTSQGFVSYLGFSPKYGSKEMARSVTQSSSSSGDEVV